MGFPKINYVALLAGTLFTVSVCLYWWGIDFSLSGATFGVFLFRWYLWSGPSTISIGSAEPAQPLTTYSPVIGALMVGSAALAFLGILPRANRLLIGSSIISIAAIISYVALVSYAISSACNGMANCINGTFGSETVGGSTLTWGYQQGFYVAIAGAVLSVVAIAFHRSFLKQMPHD